MFDVVSVLLRSLVSGIQSRRLLLLENVALRHQLALLGHRRSRPGLGPADRLFWVGLLRLWPQWRQAVVLFQPRTVVGWHRLGFRLFWRWKSRARGGRPRIDQSGIPAWTWPCPAELKAKFQNLSAAR
ncbi:MAG: hypothetical protein M1608_09425 [Candidatus Omnitrophica bacterium]|nr:hypothetical protein [Candidatus Omnitrophota bacterium]